jgi:hypothetical protein
VTILYTTVVAGTTITASWGNNVRDGLVSGFASASARASAVTAPITGMYTYRADLGTNGGYEGYTGSAWAPYQAQLIAKTTLGVAAGTIDFSSIPSVYGSLLLVGLGSLTGAGLAVDCTLKINADTGNNYSYASEDATQAALNFAGAFGNGQAIMNWALALPGSTYNADRCGGFSMMIPGYSDTSLPKIFLTDNWMADNGTSFNIKKRYGYWKGTAAINDLLFTSGSGNFSVGTHFALYGLP